MACGFNPLHEPGRRHRVGGGNLKLEDFPPATPQGKAGAIRGECHVIELPHGRKFPTRLNQGLG